MRTGRLLVLGLVAFLVAPAWAAAAVLGNAGEIYRVRAGTGETVLGEGWGTDPVLALEVLHPDGRRERHPVPGTEGAAAESDATLALDHATGAVYVVWTARRTIHSQIYIAGYEGGAWGDQLEISGDAFSTKTSPRLVVAAQGYEDLSGSTHVRQVLHLAWTDVFGPELRTLYTPIVVGDGDGGPRLYPVVDLGAGLGHQPTILDGEATPAFTLRAGNDGAAVAAFGTGEGIGAVELALLSPEVILLADHAGALAAGSDLGSTGKVERLAERIRGEVAALGQSIVSAELATALSREAFARVLATAPGSDPAALAEGLWEALVGVGSQLSRPTVSLSERARAQPIIIGRRNHTTPTDRPEVLLYRSALDLVVPQLPERPHRLFVARDGSRLLVAWNVEDGVRYLEGDRSGWSELHLLPLGSDLTRDQAYEVLAGRVDGN